ncbi:MAG: hypothetical protein ACK52I_03985 [Pseudomonadota bacterium]
MPRRIGPAVVGPSALSTRALAAGSWIAASARRGPAGVLFPPPLDVEPDSRLRPVVR